MYKVYCDNYLIHDDNLESLELFNPKVSVELNAVGSFTFTIYPDHPYFDKLQILNSIITVYQHDYILFRGRIISEVSGFHNEKQVTCESELAFLLDSVQRPYDVKLSVLEYFDFITSNHRMQTQPNHGFKLGNVTVTDPNDSINRSDSTYLTTFDTIKQKLLDKLGGYIFIRHEEDGNYIDYVEDFDTLSSQTIEFESNLLTLKKTAKADDIFTVIVPIGASVKDAQGNDAGKLTIKSVNDDKDFLVHREAEAMFGRISKMVEWKDVTIASNLKTKAQQYLNEAVLLSNSIELTAADLGSINQDISSFHLGTKVKVVSKPHNLDSILLVKKLSVDLLNPANNKIQLGSTFNSMTVTQQNNVQKSISQVVEKVESVKSDVVEATTQQINSSIQSTSQSIVNTVSESYYTKSEVAELLESQSTAMKQTSDGWEQKWTSFKQTYDSDKQGTDSQFKNIQKYIRYIDGKIILGEVGNELELRISNDRMSFYQNNSEVAYFSDNKLYVTDGEYTNSLQLGKFAFLPRTNGNLSFKKVVD